MSAEEVAKHIANAIIKRKAELILTPMGKLTVWLNKRFPRMMDKMTFNHMAKEDNAPVK
jgi:short-subunit dehydrogenase